MDYERLEGLRKGECALRLLRAENMPLIASFLHAAFIVPNRRSIALPELESMLEERLLTLRRLFDESSFPRGARQYLDDWSQPAAGFLRKYYITGSDDPHYDLSPGAERALEWLRGSLEERSFVGTESRLLTLFQMLRDFVRLSERDPETRVRELEAERSVIENEIQNVKSGLFTPLSQTQAKERFYQIEETARKLLGDFRQVEQNFRNLDGETRERITMSDEAKGRVLDKVFGDHDVIRDSEQGKSFRAFWEFLMSSRRQEELDSLIERVYGRDEVDRLQPDLFLRNIRFSLLEAADKVYRTNSRLVEQLRKFLDDRAQLESRRILEVIRAIEKSAIDLKGQIQPRAELMELADLRPTFDLPMSRGLFVPPSNPIIADSEIGIGEGHGEVNALFEQVVVDERELRRNVREALQNRNQITLVELLARFPLKHGVAEVIGYINLASRDAKSLIDEASTDEIVVSRLDQPSKVVRTPRVIFTR